MKYETLTKSVLVLPQGESIFSDRATETGIEDEAAGLFLTITQRPDNRDQTIRIDAEEWPHMRRALDKFAGMCRTRNARDCGVWGGEMNHERDISD
jgi:hypothetical protein